MKEISKSVQLEIERARIHNEFLKQKIHLPFDNDKFYYSTAINNIDGFQNMDDLYDNTILWLRDKNVLLNSISTPSNENFKLYYSKCIVGANEQRNDIILPEYYPNVFLAWLHEIYSKFIDNNLNNKTDETAKKVGNNKDNANLKSYINNINNPDPKIDIFRKANNLTIEDPFLEEFALTLYQFLFIDNNILSATSLHKIGVILLESGNQEHSKYFLEQSICLNPSYHQSYMRIGEYYSTKKNYKLAIQFNIKALEVLESEEIEGEPVNVTIDGVDGYRAEYYDNIGFAYQNLGDNLTAESWFTKAKQLNVSYFGYKYRGFDSWDELLTNTRNLYLETIEILDASDDEYDEYFETHYQNISKTIPRSEPDDLNLAREKLVIINNRLNNLSNKALSVLATSEIVYHSLINKDLKDYSALFLGYAKVIEIELKEKLFNCLPKTLRNDIGVYRATLGSYKHILKKDIVKSFLEKYYSKVDCIFLLNDVITELEKILHIRNGSAHTGILPKPKVETVRNLCLNSNFINSLISVKKK